MSSCTHWIGDEQRVCESTDDVRMFLTGARCPLHTPAAVYGRTAPTPTCTKPLRCYRSCCANELPKPAVVETTGAQRKEAGMTRALSSYEQWMNAAKSAILTLAAKREPFTSEHVVELVGLPTGRTGTNRNNAVGALMNAAARRNIITKTGRRVLASRASSHSAELTEWIGPEITRASGQ